MTQTPISQAHSAPAISNSGRRRKIAFGGMRGGGGLLFIIAFAFGFACGRMAFPRNAEALQIVEASPEAGIEFASKLVERQEAAPVERPEIDFTKPVAEMDFINKGTRRADAVPSKSNQ